MPQAEPRGARTPIIFITAMGEADAEAAKAYASGAVDFIFTPILPDVLRAKVTVFVDLFLQSQELQRSLDSITALNAALRDSDIRTQAVLDNVVDAIFILDEEGVVESVNRSVGQLFGCHADEPVGHPFACMIAPERRDEFRAWTRAQAEPLREGDLPNRVDRDRRLPPGWLHLPDGAGARRDEARRAHVHARLRARHLRAQGAHRGS